MKHLLTSFLLFIGLTSLSQTTYIDLNLQLDNYPGETSWLITQGSDTVITSPSYEGIAPGSLVEQRIFLNSGVHDFILLDVFGDGICCAFGEGYITVENQCSGILFEDYNFATPDTSYTFNATPLDRDWETKL